MIAVRAIMLKLAVLSLATVALVQSLGGRPLLGANKCTWGPAYWCDSEDNADECGARRHCEENVWGKDGPADKKMVNRALVGSNPCTWGPAYWCDSEDNADLCGARKHCEENVWGKDDKIKDEKLLMSRELLVGGNKCTWGPAHWCAHEDNAKACGTTSFCVEKVWGKDGKAKDEELLMSRALLVGSNKCTWGPAHWCAHEDNAKACGTTDYCMEKVWGQNGKAKDEELLMSRALLVGSNKCTWGPAHWCAHVDNAKACGTTDYCMEKVWGQDGKAKDEELLMSRALLVGSNKCTWGPAHWCASLENAKACGEGALSHCQERVWGKDGPSKN